MSADNELRDAVLGALANLPGALKQGVTDALWAQVMVPIEEQFYSLAAAPGGGNGTNGNYQIPAQTAGLELIKTIWVSLPAATTGRLFLGRRVYPLATGVTIIMGLSIIIGTSDLRELAVIGTGGEVMADLTGEQRPTYGVPAG